MGDLEWQCSVNDHILSLFPAVPLSRRDTAVILVFRHQ